MSAAVTRSEAEGFLYLEARLMDENRYEEWFKLWAEDGIYWVPCNDDDLDPRRKVSIIYDDYGRLQQRVDRLKSGSVLAQDPKPRMRRVVSNIEIDGMELQSNFILGHARFEAQTMWVGRSIHTLRREPDGFKIVSKKVLLINNDQEIPLLQFLV